MSAVASVLIAIVVGFSSFWLGSNRPLAWSVNAVMVGGLLMFTCLSLQLEARRHPALMISRLWAAIVMFGLGMCWAVAQIIPLGSATAGHPAWQVAGEALGRDMPSTISINPSETLWAIVRYLTAASVLLCVYVLARSAQNAQTILRTFVILTGLAALYGLTRLSLSLDKILWFDEPDTGYLTSGFINRNSAATYFGMACLASLGLVIQKVRTVLQSTSHDSGREVVRKLSLAMAGMLGFDLVLFVLMFVCLLATGSRGGISFTILALFFMLLLYGVKATMRGRSAGGGLAWIAIILVIAALMLGVFELSGARLTGRLLDQGLEAGARFEVYAQTWLAVRDYLFLGSGLGTFQDVFTAYRLELSAGRKVWDKAHNDYLELLLGLGLPAAALVLMSFASLFSKVTRGFFARHRDTHYAAISAAACVLVGLHSLVDFSLQIQANALAFALLLGVGLAQSWSTRA
ncbi:O-antigen ligase family protein [Anderseniella sp. Alg231-50]|uniref:O-antigen ligase family protein n=1 Tax=Anderseniella sp. Alg231-50 TaxID=1922226 RepID=UPI000D552CE8